MPDGLYTIKLTQKPDKQESIFYYDGNSNQFYSQTIPENGNKNAPMTAETAFITTLTAMDLSMGNLVIHRIAIILSNMLASMIFHEYTELVMYIAGHTKLAKATDGTIKNRTADKKIIFFILHP